MNTRRAKEIFAVWECFADRRHIVATVTRADRGVVWLTLCGRTFTHVEPDRPGGYCSACSQMKRGRKRRRPMSWRRGLDGETDDPVGTGPVTDDDNTE